MADGKGFMNGPNGIQDFLWFMFLGVPVVIALVVIIGSIIREIVT